MSWETNKREKLSVLLLCLTFTAGVLAEPAFAQEQVKSKSLPVTQVTTLCDTNTGSSLSLGSNSSSCCDQISQNSPNSLVSNAGANAHRRACQLRPDFSKRMTISEYVNSKYTSPELMELRVKLSTSGKTSVMNNQIPSLVKKYNTFQISGANKP